MINQFPAITPSSPQLNCTTVDPDTVDNFYAGTTTLQNAFEPYSKRRKIDSGPAITTSLPFANTLQLSGTAPDLWPHYLHPDFETVKMEQEPVVSSTAAGLYAEHHILDQQQDNYISLMLRSDDRPGAESQPPAQLTKL